MHFDVLKLKNGKLTLCTVDIEEIHTFSRKIKSEEVYFFRNFPEIRPIFWISRYLEEITISKSVNEKIFSSDKLIYG